MALMSFIFNRLPIILRPIHFGMRLRSISPKTPVPDDAVILADYILMADFVAQTATGPGYISKGVRKISTGRDHHYDSENGTALNVYLGSTQRVTQDFATIGSSGTTADDMTVKIPLFGTQAVVQVEETQNASHVTDFNGVTSRTELQDGSSDAEDITISGTTALGMNLLTQTVKGATNIFQEPTSHHQPTHLTTINPMRQNICMNCWVETVLWSKLI